MTDDIQRTSGQLKTIRLQTREDVIKMNIESEGQAALPEAVESIVRRWPVLVIGAAQSGPRASRHARTAVVPR